MIEMEKQAYLNLVTYRNSTKEKYMKFVDMILEYPISLGAVTDSFLFAFDLENAAGVNLDTIGDVTVTFTCGEDWMTTNTEP